MKLLSTETIDLIEQIVIECGLENEFLEKDLILKEKLENEKNLKHRFALKILYSKEIRSALDNKKPLSDILPSFAISEGMKKILNKKLSPSQLPIFLQNKLNIGPVLADKISNKLLNSQSFKKDLIGDSEEDYLAIPSNRTPKGIGQELV